MTGKNIKNQREEERERGARGRGGGLENTRVGWWEGEGVDEEVRANYEGPDREEIKAQ